MAQGERSNVVDPAPAHDPQDAGRQEYDLINDGLVPLCIVGMLWAFSRFALDVRSVVVAGDAAVVRFVLFWFLVGVVGIAKIEALRGGPALALPYKLGLATATGFFILRYSVTDVLLGDAGGGLGASVLLNSAVFAAVWWGATRLTRDCTVFAGTEEADSQGLLDEALASAGSGNGTLPRRARPGKSVFAFSAVALPVFGLGQLVLARGDPGLYRSSYYSVGAYVFFALLLLALTNLSGLKLYLAGKNLSPPRKLVSMWAASALVLTALVMLLAVLVPRRDLRSEDTLVARGLRVSELNAPQPPLAPVSGTAQPRGAPRVWRPDERSRANPSRDGSPRRGESGSEGRSERGESAGPEPDGNANGGGQGAEPGSGGQEGQGEGAGAGQGEGGQPSRQPPPPPPPVPSELMQLLTWLLVALAAAALVWALIRRRQSVWAALRALAQLPSRVAAALGALLSRWMGGRGRAPRGPRDRGTRIPVYTNPFGSSAEAASMSAHELIAYTYGALMAQADRLGTPRRADQTALEFASDLPQPLRPLRDEIRDLTRMYVEAEYAEGTDLARHRERLERIWCRLDDLAADVVGLHSSQRHRRLVGS